MKHETIKKVTETRYSCDLCVDSRQYNMLHICSYCKRHMCNDHMEILDRDPIDGSDYGDYPLRICTECYQIVKTGKLGEQIRLYQMKQADLDKLYDHIYDMIMTGCKQ